MLIIIIILIIVTIIIVRYETFKRDCTRSHVVEMPNILVIRKVMAKGWVCIITNKITENLIEKSKLTI